jgi:hypothetical protein
MPNMVGTIATIAMNAATAVPARMFRMPKIGIGTNFALATFLLPPPQEYLRVA